MCSMWMPGFIPAFSYLKLLKNGGTPLNYAKAAPSIRRLTYFLAGGLSEINTPLWECPIDLMYKPSDEYMLALFTNPKAMWSDLRIGLDSDAWYVQSGTKFSATLFTEYSFSEQRQLFGYCLESQSGIKELAYCQKLLDEVSCHSIPFEYLNCHLFEAVNPAYKNLLSVKERYEYMKYENAIAATIPAAKLERMQEKLGQLRASLLSEDPEMARYLQDIHRAVIEYPESVHLLDDGEIAAIISGLQKHTDVAILKKTVKAASSGRKVKASQLSIDSI